MSDISQALISQGYQPQEVEAIMAVMNEPLAAQYAMATQNFLGAYHMTQHYKDSLKKKEASLSAPVEEKSSDPSIDLNTWFSSFATDAPEDAAALSSSLTKFARYVQSALDKSKASK